MIYTGIDTAKDKHALKSPRHYRYNIIIVKEQKYKGCKRNVKILKKFPFS